MSNMPDTDKKLLTVLLPLELIAQLKKEYKARKMKSVSELVLWILHRELSRVVLTAKDYLWISQQVKKNEDNRRKSLMMKRKERMAKKGVK